MHARSHCSSRSQQLSSVKKSFALAHSCEGRWAEHPATRNGGNSTTERHLENDLNLHALVHNHGVPAAAAAHVLRRCLQLADPCAAFGANNRTKSRASVSSCRTHGRSVGRGGGADLNEPSASASNVTLPSTFCARPRSLMTTASFTASDTECVSMLCTLKWAESDDRGSQP